MIMLTQPTPSDHLIYLLIWLILISICYNSCTAASQTTSEVNILRVKSPTKTHTDLHNGD